MPTSIRVGIELAGLRMPPKRALQAAAQAGADAVELDATGDFAPRQFSDTGLRQLRKMLADLRLGVAAISFRTQQGYDTPANLDARIEGTKAAMQFAGRLGARSVVNHLGRVPDSDDSPASRLLIEVLTELADYGNYVGSCLAAETGSESGEDLARLMDQLPEGTIGVNFNPGNLAAAGHSPLEALSALGSRVLHVHATDGVCDLASQRGELVDVGQGMTDFAAVIGTLGEFGYDGYFTIRPRAPEQAAAAIQFLRKI